MREVHVLKYNTASGTRYMYRFEIASIGGKRNWVSKKGFTTKNAAKEAGQEAYDAYEITGVEPVKQELSYSDYLDYWLKYDCSVDLKETTVRGYERCVNNLIKPNIGKYYVSALNKELLQRFIVILYDNGYARETLINVKALLTKSLSYAEDHGFIRHSPAVRLKIPRGRVPKVPTRSNPHIVIPEAKMKEIFEKYQEIDYDRYYRTDVQVPAFLPLKLGYECGLRLGETFGLCWEDIDLENKTLSVNRQMQWQEDKSRTKAEKERTNGSKECGDGYWYYTNPKCCSYRTIEVSDALIEILKREKERQKKAEEYYGEYYTHYYVEIRLDYSGKAPKTEVYKNRISEKGKYPIHPVLVRDNGRYITPRVMTTASKYIHDNILEDFDYHSLRHTHATMLCENGVNIKYIQKRLGHADINITMNIYEHLTDKMRDEGRAHLNEIYKTEEKEEN